MTGSEKGKKDDAENFIRERARRSTHHPSICPSLHPTICYLFSHRARCVSIGSPTHLLTIRLSTHRPSIPSSTYSPPTICPSTSLPTISPSPAFSVVGGSIHHRRLRMLGAVPGSAAYLLCDSGQPRQPLCSHPAKQSCSALIRRGEWPSRGEAHHPERCSLHTWHSAPVGSALGLAQDAGLTRSSLRGARPSRDSAVDEASGPSAFTEPAAWLRHRTCAGLRCGQASLIQPVRVSCLASRVLTF